MHSLFTCQWRSLRRKRLCLACNCFYKPACVHILHYQWTVLWRIWTQMDSPKYHHYTDLLVSHSDLCWLLFVFGTHHWPSRTKPSQWNTFKHVVKLGHLQCFNTCDCTYLLKQFTFNFIADQAKYQSVHATINSLRVYVTSCNVLIYLYLRLTFQKLFCWLLYFEVQSRAILSNKKPLRLVK